MTNKTRKNKNYRQTGFTLMEIMVAMGIFVVVALASLSIYASVLRASRRTTAYTRIQQEAQLVMEVLAKKIRTSRVNYSYYGDIGPKGNRNIIIESDGENTLALTDLSGNDYLFSLSGNSLVIQTKASGQSVYSTPVPIPSTSVDIIDANFYIQPLSYPFDIDYPPETQPRVTLALTFRSTKGSETASFTVQETVPQRSGGIVD